MQRWENCPPPGNTCKPLISAISGCRTIVHTRGRRALPRDAVILRHQLNTSLSSRPDGRDPASILGIVTLNRSTLIRIIAKTPLPPSP